MGTVTETTYYTYKENCFEGEIEEGDLFGGAVCFLADNNNTIKAAVGAYHDSGNGFRKGAVWVMDLFDRQNYEVNIVTNPSCGDSNGVFAVTGALARETYTLRYDYKGNTKAAVLEFDSNGEVLITGLTPGLYSNIRLALGTSGCTVRLDNIELTEASLNLEIESTNPTFCDTFDGAIVISGAIEGEVYTVSYRYNESVKSAVFTADANGQLLLLGLKPGVYSQLKVIVDSSGCSGDLADVELTCDENQACFEIRKFFTPNADGKNDYWQLEMKGGKCDYTIYIYDRFGKLLQTLNRRFKRWDGTYNGKNMPSNDYWYKIVYSNDEKHVLRGHFTLKR